TCRRYMECRSVRSAAPRPRRAGSAALRSRWCGCAPRCRRASGGLLLGLAFLLGGLARGAVGARARRRLGDHDVAVRDLRRRVALPGGERVLEVPGVVTFGEPVEALVRAARLAPLERRVRQGAGDVELEAEL